MSWRTGCKSRSVMRRLGTASLVLTLVLIGVARAEPDIRFEPPSSVDAAQERYERGKKLYQAKQYASAALEFAAAYELDAHAKFLLFNLGLARRMAGACKEALVAYRAFLEANPPDPAASNARIGIERCEQVISSLPPAPPDPEPAPPPSRAPDAPVRPAAAPSPTTPPTQPPDARPTPWYRDGVGAVLVGTGTVGVIASVTLYALARRSAAATFSPTSFDDYEANRTRASRLETASWISGGVSAALLVGGAIQLARHPDRRTVAVTPTRGGAALVVEGRW